MGEGSSGEQVFTRQSWRKELPGGMKGMYKGIKARQSLTCLGRCKWFRGPRKGVLGEKRKQGVGWHEKSETDWDLGPFMAVLVPGQTSSRVTKYKETIRD